MNDHDVNHPSMNETFNFTLTEAQICAFHLKKFLKNIYQNANKTDEEAENVDRNKFMSGEVPNLNTAFVYFFLPENLLIDEIFGGAGKVLEEGIREANDLSLSKHARVEESFVHISSMFQRLKLCCRRIFEEIFQDKSDKANSASARILLSFINIIGTFPKATYITHTYFYSYFIPKL